MNHHILKMKFPEFSLFLDKKDFKGFEGIFQIKMNLNIDVVGLF